MDFENVWLLQLSFKIKFISINLFLVVQKNGFTV